MPDKEWEGYASWDDLLSRLPDGDRASLVAASDEVKTRVRTLLLDASHMIRARCPAASRADARVLKSVTCRVVQRALRDRNGVPGDATSVSQTAGPFTMQMAWNNPSGDLFLTKQDRDDINGSGGSGFYEADVLLRPYRKAP